MRECLGAQRCPYGGECFVEKSREAARAADLVVTNHALLAIDAMHGGTALPEHQRRDHRRGARAGLPGDRSRLGRAEPAARRAGRPAGADLAGRRRPRHRAAGLGRHAPGRAGGDAAGAGRGRRRRFGSRPARPYGPRPGGRSAHWGAGTDKNEPEQRQAAAAVKEVFDVAERMAALSEHDVVWVADRERSGREARVAPLSVAGLMRSRVFGEHTTVLTSATLKLGGDFTGVAGSVGLREDERVRRATDLGR